MLQLMNKYKKGTKLEFGKNVAVVTSDLMKFKEFYAIYADIEKNIDNNLPCLCLRIHDKVALIIRYKEELLKMRTDYRRKKSYILS